VAAYDPAPRFYRTSQVGEQGEARLFSIGRGSRNLAIASLTASVFQKYREPRKWLAAGKRPALTYLVSVLLVQFRSKQISLVLMYSSTVLPPV
jgi:hypothetical protein